MSAAHAARLHPGRLTVNKDAERLTVMQSLVNGALDIHSAAGILGLTVRQVYRLKARAKSKGIRHVLHRGKGRTPPNKIPAEVWDKILCLARGLYPALNDYELREALARNHKILISREALRKKLRSSGIPPVRKREKGNPQYECLSINRSTF